MTASIFSLSLLDQRLPTKAEEATTDTLGQAVGIVRLSLSEILKANSKQFPSASSVEFSLHKLCGILAVQVDRSADKIELRYDLSITSAENMIRSLSNMNFSTQNKCIVDMDPVVTMRAKESGDNRTSGNSGRKLLFSGRGMSCANCAATVEKHLMKQSIVRSASVSSMTNKAKVVLKESVNDVDVDVESPEGITGLEEMVYELEKQVRTLGYGCEWIKPLNMSGSPSQSKYLLSIIGDLTVKFLFYRQEKEKRWQCKCKRRWRRRVGWVVEADVLLAVLWSAGVVFTPRNGYHEEQVYEYHAYDWRRLC